MINSENVIEVCDVHKFFKVYKDRGRQLKDVFVYRNLNKYTTNEVLRGISFSVKKGESIALIGHNGCGKSTTLKLLTRILRPNAGTVELNGRVASLIELGAGFHPDMSGRENIYINASIFGFKKREIDRKVDDIIRFSELEEYIDNPVRTYSSGMYARLAFSVAISVEADILLVDEILSVGDAAFQAKCFSKMKELKNSGVTIVIVSHSMGQVQQICDRALWIENGKIREEGNPKLICKHYLDDSDQKRLSRIKDEIEREEKAESTNIIQEETSDSSQETVNSSSSEKTDNIVDKSVIDEEKKKGRRDCINIAEQCGPDAERVGNGNVRITSVKLLNSNNELANEFQVREKIKIIIGYKTLKENQKGNFSISISNREWIFCYETFAIRRKKNYPTLRKQGEVSVDIDSLNLVEGRYLLSVKAIDENVETSELLSYIIPFSVGEQAVSEIGVSSMPHQWKIDGVETSLE